MSSGRQTAAGARARHASRCAARRASRAWAALGKSVYEPIEITLNGQLGLVFPSGDGHRAALSFVVSDGRIRRIDAIRNPEKLRRV
jgi:RNA polymerase sigma-70 factor (ECF subfamily)